MMNKERMPRKQKKEIQKCKYYIKQFNDFIKRYKQEIKLRQATND